MNELKFFKCKNCGDVVIRLLNENSECKPNMEELVANTVDASSEKHLPVAVCENGFVKVKVGSIMHPMEQAHYIQFIAVQTEDSYILKTLSPEKAPEVEIYVGEEKPVAIYEYCSLHGLWKTEL